MCPEALVAVTDTEVSAVLVTMRWRPRRPPLSGIAPLGVPAYEYTSDESQQKAKEALFCHGM